MLVKILVTFSEVTLLNNKKMETSLNIYWNPLGKSCSKQPVNIFLRKQVFGYSWNLGLKSLKNTYLRTYFLNTPVLPVTSRQGKI